VTGLHTVEEGARYPKEARARQAFDRQECCLLHEVKTKNRRNISYYRALLESAVTSVVSKSKEKGVKSLFSRDGATGT